ncbi:MAG: pyridoxamine 5'-phosphate oxidase family protein [Methanobacteriaceae archaeon]|jgi:nitroimidazol reductase NimA-like FMN-containing flavoprotein (pyridoxamine 5'-phosphate oxidase superfamily)|nr:pyridoxamine 5'-phosphate oxidase family protein [Candidatus Methanorudis spinitermitis]
MRRKDKEVVSIENIIEIVKKCEVCRIAFFDKNYPYIIPLNFGYEYSYEHKELNLYFHSVNEGKKISLIESNPQVGFEMDCSLKVISGKSPCDYGMSFESVCGNGKIKILNGEEKVNGLKHLINQYSKDKNYKFDKKVLKNLTVFKLIVNEITGKKSRKTP